MKRILAIIVALFISSWAYAGTVGFQFDNDVLGSEKDRHYTSALSIYYLSETFPLLDNYMLKDLDVMYLIGVNQKMYTPDNISYPGVIYTDRPYAGSLALDLGVEIYKNNSADSIVISLGTTGEASLAEKTQKNVHEWIGSKEPMGWDNQIGEMAVFQLGYQRKYKYASKIGNILEYDVIPNGGVSFGTMYTYANLGFMGRIGNKVPKDYAMYRMEPTIRGIDFKLYGIYGVEGKYVIDNTFLNGYKSHGVEAEDFVGDLYTGIGTTVGKFNISYLFTWRSKEFEGQDESDRFGSIIMSCGF